MKQQLRTRLKLLLIRAAAGLTTLAAPGLAAAQMPNPGAPVTTSSGYRWETTLSSGPYRDFSTEKSASGVSVLVGPPAINLEDVEGFCSSRSDLFHDFHAATTEDGELLEALEARQALPQLIGKRFWLLGSAPRDVSLYNGNTGVISDGRSSLADRLGALCLSYTDSNVFGP